MLCGMFGAKLAAVASQGFGANLRRGIYNKVQEFSFADIDHSSSASLITRITNDVNAIQMMVTMALRMLVRAPVMLVAALAVSISINARLAMVMLVAIPLLVIAIGVLMSMCNHLFQVLQTRIDALNGTVQENLVGIRVVKAFVRAGYEKTKLKIQRRPDQGRHQCGYASHRHDAHHDDRPQRRHRRRALPGRLHCDVRRHAHRRPLLLYHLYLPDSDERHDAGNESAAALPRHCACARRIDEVLETEPSIEDGSCGADTLPAPRARWNSAMWTSSTRPGAPGRMFSPTSTSPSAPASSWLWWAVPVPESPLW
ncbi:MAG: ABC transporter permease [Intestinimonas sp.]